MKDLRQLFDFQKYEGNSRLASIIVDTESRHMGVVSLSDDELDMVNAGVNVATPKNDNLDSSNTLLNSPK